MSPSLLVAQAWERFLMIIHAPEILQHNSPAPNFSVFMVSVLGWRTPSNGSAFLEATSERKTPPPRDRPGPWEEFNVQWVVMEASGRSGRRSGSWETDGHWIPPLVGLTFKGL